MGNCIRVLSDESHQRVRIVTFEGKEKKFKASTPIKRITSGRYCGYKLVHQAKPHLPLPHDAKLVPEEAYYLVPEEAYYLVPDPSVYRTMTGQQSCEKQRVKIVITRQQLEFLLRNANNFQSAKVSPHFPKRWGPSLASIPEVDEF